MQPTVGDLPGSAGLIRERLEALERRLGEPVDAEVAHVDPRSCGLVLAVLHGLCGVVYCLGRMIQESAGGREVDFRLLLLLVVAGLVVGFLAGLVPALLYNAVARAVGGVRVRVRVDPR